MREQYENLMQVLDNVGFSDKETRDMEQLLVTILHIGNIEFNEGDDSYAELAEATPIDFGLLRRKARLAPAENMLTLIDTLHAALPHSGLPHWLAAGGHENDDGVHIQHYARREVLQEL